MNCHTFIVLFCCMMCPTIALLHNTRDAMNRAECDDCCQANCSSHGLCRESLGVQVDVLEEKSCTCFDGWVSPNCSVKCDNIDDCSGHGVCSDIGSCECNQGYVGKSCQYSCTQQTCRGHGQCNPNAGSPDLDICLCDEGWVGVTCSYECSEKTTCNGHGKCLLSGACLCDQNWAVVSDCSLFCSRNFTCSGHGVCQHGNSGVYCTCGSGWVGNDPVKNRYCMYRCNPVVDCSNQGVCNNKGSCDCNPGFYGNKCDVEPCKEKPYFCSGHGFCTLNQTCICDNHYFGEQCGAFCQANSSCSAKGICTPEGDCLCDSQFTGVHCEQEIQESSSYEDDETSSWLWLVAMILGTTIIGCYCATCWVSQKSHPIDGPSGYAELASFRDHGVRRSYKSQFIDCICAPCNFFFYGHSRRLSRAHQTANYYNSEMKDYIGQQNIETDSPGSRFSGRFPAPTTPFMPVSLFAGSIAQSSASQKAPPNHVHDPDKFIYLPPMSSATKKKKKTSR